MLTEATTPGTDDWWLVKLASELGADFPRLHNLRRYRTGDAPVPDEANGGMREALKKFVQQGRLHLTDLIVSSKIDRMEVVGFRTAAADDDLGDTEAWTEWKRSYMHLTSRELLADAGHYGAAYIGVAGPDGDEPGHQLTFSPWQVRTIAHPVRKWEAQAAIQVGYDELEGYDFITLYIDGTARTAVKYTERTTIPNNGSRWSPGTDWTWLGAAQTIPWLDGQGTPIVKVPTPSGLGFYEAHLDTLDRINDTIRQRLVIIAMQAFRQRAIKGDLPMVYPPEHEKAGEPVDYNELFASSPAALWMIPGDAEVWESALADITPVLSANKDDVKNLAAATATPLYILSPDAAAGSAEGASLARESLIFSVRPFAQLVAAAIASSMALSFLANGNASRADATQIEVLWAPIDRVSMLDRAAAASQAKAGGLPQTMIDSEIWGLSPQMVRQAAQWRQDEQLLALSYAETQ